MNQCQSKELELAHLFTGYSNDAVFEALRRTILVDDYLDEKTKIIRLVELMHAYYGFL